MLHPVRIYRECRDWIKHTRFEWKMRGRNLDKELWVFSQKSDNKFTLTVKERPNSLAALLVALGLAESNSDAMRLLKSRSIEQREWYGDNWWEVPKDIIVGYPQWIRRGKKMYGVALYMIPQQDQTEGLWLELVNE